MRFMTFKKKSMCVCKMSGKTGC